MYNVKIIYSSVRLNKYNSLEDLDVIIFKFYLKFITRVKNHKIYDTHVVRNKIYHKIGTLSFKIEIKFLKLRSCAQ